MAPCPLCFLGFESPHSKEDWAELKKDDVQQRLEDEGYHETTKPLLEELEEEKPYEDQEVWDPVIGDYNMRWMAEHNAGQAEVSSKGKCDEVN